MLSKQSHQAYLIFKNQIRENELKSIPRSPDKIKKDIILGNIYENGGTMSALGNKLTPQLQLLAQIWIWVEYLQFLSKDKK